MGWGQKLVLKPFGKAVLSECLAGEVSWAVGARGEGLQEQGAIEGLQPCAVGLEPLRQGVSLGQGGSWPCHSAPGCVKPGIATWGGHQTLPFCF